MSAVAMVPCHPVAGLYATVPKNSSKAYIVDDFGNAIDVLADNDRGDQWIDHICSLVRTEH